MVEGVASSQMWVAIAEIASKNGDSGYGRYRRRRHWSGHYSDSDVQRPCWKNPICTRALGCLVSERNSSDGADSLIKVKRQGKHLFNKRRGSEYFYMSQLGPIFLEYCHKCALCFQTEDLPLYFRMSHAQVGIQLAGQLQ